MNMKNIIKIAIVALAGSMFAISCDKNAPKSFDDSNAFVAFDKESVSISESILKDGQPTTYGDTIKIPVTLGSIAGLEASIKFEVVPDTLEKDGKKFVPKEGENFSVLTEGGTLKFDADHRTQYITVSGIYFPEYTGDLSFRIVLKESSSVNLGCAKACKVVIVDVDHPLAALLGTYTASGADLWDGPTTWPMTLSKDPDDPHKVWIFDWANLKGNASAVGPIYGNVDDDMTVITIPLGQKMDILYKDLPVLCLGLTADLGGMDSGSTTAKITKDPTTGVVKSIYFDDEYGFWCYGEAGANFAAVLPGCMGTPFFATK